MSERTEFKAYDHQDIRVMTTFGEGGAPLNDSGITAGDRFAVPSVEATTPPKPKMIRGMNVAQSGR